MTKQKLLENLDALRGVAGMLPDDTVVLRPDDSGLGWLQLYCPDEARIEAVYERKFEQRDFSEAYDERHIIAGGVKLFWLVEKRADDA